jgi:hypothetical protein
MDRESIRDEQDARKLDPPPFGLFAGDKCGDRVRIVVRPLDRTRKGRGGNERRQADDG